MELKVELSAEEKLLCSNIWYEIMLQKITAALEEKYGDEAKKILKQVYYEVGKEVAIKVREVLGVKGTTPADYARVHYYQDTNFWGIKEKVSVDDEGKATIRVSSCPAHGVYEGKDCAMFVPFIKGMFEVINPKLQWEAPKILTRGDDCCEFIISEGKP